MKKRYKDSNVLLKMYEARVSPIRRVNIPEIFPINSVKYYLLDVNIYIYIMIYMNIETQQRPREKRFSEGFKEHEMERAGTRDFVILVTSKKYIKNAANPQKKSRADRMDSVFNGLVPEDKS